MTSTSERVGSHVEDGVGSNANRIALAHIDYPEPPLDPSFIRHLALFATTDRLRCQVYGPSDNARFVLG